ncbi:MAG: glycosyltransferase family 87 protein [Candidatus Limnocylindrales bacterium]
MSARSLSPLPAGGPSGAAADHAPAVRAHGRRAAVFRRALQRELSRLREPRRILAIVLLGVAGAIALTWLISRGDLVGADARAYWVGVRTWLAGGDPYHPLGPFLPYVYAPWLLPLFVPWALLPWDVAWFVWSGLNVLLFLWTAEWAYRRHPLATAGVIWLLLVPLIATFDTGNVTLFLALAVWAAQFVGPRLGGALWAVAASMKWFPVLLFVFLPPRARLWGLVAAAVAILLMLATWPQTLVQIDAALNFPRPIRLDYLLLLWAAVPWLWRHPHPLWWLDRQRLPGLVRAGRTRLAVSWRRWRRDPETAAIAARRGAGLRVRAFFGLG